MESERTLDLRTPIGHVIKAWRETRGLTRPEGLTLPMLAERVTQERRRIQQERAPNEKPPPAVSKGYLSEVERGVIHTPGNDTLEAIARALEIPISHLVMRQFPPAPPRIKARHIEAGAYTARPAQESLAFGALADEEDDDDLEPIGSSVGPHTIGHEIASLIAAADLNNQEEELLADRLVAVTNQLVSLIKGARGLEGGPQRR